MGKGETGQVRRDGQEPHEGAPAKDVPQPGEAGETRRGPTEHGEAIEDSTGNDRGEATESRPDAGHGQLPGTPETPEKDTEHGVGAMPGHHTATGRGYTSPALED